MKVTGQALLHAPIERVWAALNDPDVLARTIPGCQRLQPTGPDAYAMTVTAGVASIKGTYAGSVQLSELQQPASFLMKASGAGGPGTVSADVRVSLSEDAGNTRLSYDADAVVGGVIGGVGQRMLVGVAKKLAGQFFTAVDDELTGKLAAPAASQTSAQAPAAGPGQLSQAAPSGLSFPSVLSTPSGLAAPSEQAPRDFVLGAFFGAASALLGVLVGARLSCQRAQDRRWQ